MDVIENSHEKNKVEMSKEIQYYTNKLRDFMFENVYLNKKSKKEEDKAQYIIEQLYDCFLRDYENIPLETRVRIYEFGLEEVVKDYIAGMTDRYIINKYLEIYVPKVWRL